MATHESSASKLNIGYILLLSLVAAFGGFLFGYDTGVVNGSVEYLSKLLSLGDKEKGFAAGVMLLGCMCGVMVAGPLGDRIGRKKGLILCGILFGVSSLLTALPNSLWPFALARFAGGVAIGAVSILSPIYIAEIAPERIRGLLVSFYQLAIVLGISGAFFVNMLIQRQGDEAWNQATGWRWMFAVLALPSAFFTLLVLLVPESPRWLVKMGQRDAGRRILETIGGSANADREMAQIEEALGQEEGRWSELLSPGYLRALLVGTVLAVFSQFSGINTIMYYSSDVFKSAGGDTDVIVLQIVLVCGVVLADLFVWVWCARRLWLAVVLAASSAAAVWWIFSDQAVRVLGTVLERPAGADPAAAAAFNQTVIVGIIMTLFTFVATGFVDRVGRRPLLLMGTAGQTLTLALVGATFFFAMKGPWLLLGVLGFVAAFAMAMGPVSWIVNSEIFPNKLRGRAMGVSILLLWFADYLVTQTFPVLEKSIGQSWTFWMYAAFSLASLLFVFFFLPETKGKTLEEIERRWLKA